MKYVERIPLFKEQLRALDAQYEFIEAVGNKTLSEYWNTSVDPRTMNWLLIRMVGKKGWLGKAGLIYIHTQVVRTIEDLLFDQRSLNALEVYENFCAGTASEEVFNNARISAFAAYKESEKGSMDSREEAIITLGLCSAACAAVVYFSSSPVVDVISATCFCDNFNSERVLKKKEGEICNLFRELVQIPKHLHIKTL